MLWLLKSVHPLVQGLLRTGLTRWTVLLMVLITLLSIMLTRLRLRVVRQSIRLLHPLYSPYRLRVLSRLTLLRLRLPWLLMRLRRPLIAPPVHPLVQLRLRLVRLMRLTVLVKRRLLRLRHRRMLTLLETTQVGHRLGQLWQASIRMPLRPLRRTLRLRKLKLRSRLISLRIMPIKPLVDRLTLTGLRLTVRLRRSSRTSLRLVRWLVRTVLHTLRLRVLLISPCTFLVALLLLN